MGLTVVVTVTPKINEDFPWVEIIYLKFASVELDSDEQQKKFIECEAQLQHDESGNEYKKYIGEIEVPENFGEIGAVIVGLQDGVNERFIDNISIVDQTPENSITFSCKSWVQPKCLIDQRRIFFSTKSYLPGSTPAGLVKLRTEDLANLRGQKADGTVDTNERKAFERIYDYDVYNDLGDPDSSEILKRPVLGGSNQYPYPRRCRTGRPHCRTDPSSEQRSTEMFYVPRDEEFSEVKQHYFPISKPESKNLLEKVSFSDLPQIDSMFRDGIKMRSIASEILQFDIQSIVSPDQPALNLSDDVPSTLLQFPPPESYRRDRYNWLSDTEFARQTLAGLNPYSIQLVKSLPFMSELDPVDYGPRESAFTPLRVQELLGSSITVDQAIAQKKLFVLDYHDTLMEYVKKVRNINETTLYGSRTLFFLKPDDTLMPLGIELTRPPMDEKPQWKQVFTPSSESTNVWLWRLAKAHVLSHDSCIHQLVIHWLRAHACMEPYAIATNRQLSTMHPIYRLLHPHFRYNMRINANARATLINAGGIIESTFSAASYSMEISSRVYKKEWRFDEQALPEDLIRRGMAKRKEDAPLGIELVIKDYPFANDGLILWDALLKWVKEYVSHYYGDDENAIMNDNELQAWWREVQEKGHPDKMEGWPMLRTRDDLIKIVSTIAWVGSGHHASVNFIQYAYAGHIPNRPSIARKNMLTEDSHQLPDEFIEQPENELVKLFPSVDQTLLVTKTMVLLSAHSPDEEYIGDAIEPAWDLEPSIREAFERFKQSLNDLEKHIGDSNKNSKLKNRHGAGVMPYDVLKPRSEPGITGRGVPYSVSI
ncbi:lipoxygenase 2, chloroplastic-like [Benincasa hispida]|uniref:lipoxygenase 2, chloroplastic-like n=1 Tax=Benincasa hispida TaxID=102211 RepID=UPI001902C157|nr:lipoxygenase 2, chloroplastic-like [Benincasa hispida]